ncbi:MAG TPA: TonB family protein [Pyrinomonadaceae bacterium]|nr:TonB family protein [Pyrinomonadaceae bacterium]
MCNLTAQRPSESVETGKCQIPIYKGRDADRKAKILAKPEPKYTTAERRQYRGESITLRAVLCGSGEVMEITVKSGVAPGVDEKAIDAARRIQFVPGQKDGQPISTAVTVLYKVK